MVGDEPTHLIICSIVKDNPILPIDRIVVVGFWSHPRWMGFFQVKGSLIPILFL